VKWGGTGERGGVVTFLARIVETAGFNVGREWKSIQNFAENHPESGLTVKNKQRVAALIET
jgi:hypothetical protein